jgi:protein TonB
VAPPKLTLPEAAFRDAGATVLIAGVVSAARDLARRASRPEDFVPEPPAKLAAELLVHTGVYLPAVMRPNLHVDDLPVPLVGNPPPAYPASLERARVGGQVVVEFRIDSTGAVDEGSLRVVRSTDALFTQAVRGVLPRLRFVPAQLGQRAVGITVQQPFVFTVRSGL